MSTGVKGKYIIETEYAPKQVSGINYMTNEKDVIVSFFDEIPTFPDSFEFETTESGSLAQKDFVSDENAVIRVVQARIRMGKKEAVAIFRFLADSIEGEINDNDGE